MIQYVKDHELIGKKYEDVKTEWAVRLVRKDDEDFFITMDWNPRRINVEVDNGIITKVYYG